MDIYNVIKAFDSPLLTVGETVSKYSHSINTLVGTVQLPDKAFWGWIGSPDSLNYLVFARSVPDPLSLGSPGDWFIVQGGVAYLKNATTGKYNAIRANGPDGNVTIEIDQTGVVL